MNPGLVRTGLLLPAAAVWVAALGATALPRAAPAAAAVAVAAVVPLLVRAVRRRSRAAVLLVAGSLACGAVLAAVAAGDARRHPDALPAGRPAAVDVRVDQVTAIAGNDRAGSLVARRMLRGAIQRADGEDMDVPVLLFAGAGELPDPVPGSVLRLRAVLHRSSPTDAAAFVGPIVGRTALVGRPPPAQVVAAGLRRGLLERTAGLPGDGAALLPGLAVGDTTRVAEDLRQAMQDASLTHLTAVSGANCAVVTVAVFWLAGLLRAPRVLRILLAGAALAAFVVLVTPQPSVVRASAMAGVALLCALRGGRAAGVPALALAVLVLLVADPWLAWSPGFALSAAATAGLLLLAPPLADRLARVVPRRLAVVLAVPIAAQAACQPILVLLQPGIPVLGVVANLLAEPAAPVVTVLGLLACLLGPVAPLAAGAAAVLAWVPAAWIGLVARTAARFPQLGWPVGAIGAVLAGALVLAGVLLLTRTGRLRRLGGAVSAVAVVVIVGTVAGGAIGRLAGTPTGWTFASCDVGQGDGLVLNGGGGHFAVVDTGREDPPIAACLSRLGVGRIDLLVLTHWDADHVGAARAIAGRVATAFVGPTDGAAAVALRADLARAGARLHLAHRGEVVRLGGLRLEVLWPPDPLSGVEPGNAASITLHVTGGGTSLLLAGDLGEDAQDAILAAGPLPRVDVVKVAHHGSSDQSPAFYAAAGAAFGIISVGAGNDYGHPTRRLLRILRGAGTQAVRTDQEGLVLVSWSSGRVRVWSERPVTAAVWTPAK